MGVDRGSGSSLLFHYKKAELKKIQTFRLNIEKATQYTLPLRFLFSCSSHALFSFENAFMSLYATIKTWVVKCVYQKKQRVVKCVCVCDLMILYGMHSHVHSNTRACIRLGIDVSGAAMAHPSCHQNGPTPLWQDVIFRCSLYIKMQLVKTIGLWHATAMVGYHLFHILSPNYSKLKMGLNFAHA